MKLKIFMILILFSSVFTLNLLTGCGEMVSSSNNLVFPDSSVSYIINVEPFMRVKCAYSGCHCEPPNNTSTPMTTWFELMGSENLGLVVAYKPDSSILIQILEEKLPHNYNAFPHGYITQNQIKGMRKWIEEGAKNN
ncbi:MAG: hypothetical protein EPN82_10065 [Bacteroidetes bacterium]|nr:MAG: hypothetical protein EPN82_10065 [Bacteroidota bacterium]